MFKNYLETQARQTAKIYSRDHIFTWTGGRWHVGFTTKSPLLKTFVDIYA